MTDAKRIGSVILVVISCTVHSVANDRRFTVRDSIEMSRFSGTSDADPTAGPLVSPNGRYSLVVTSRGLIKSNEVISTIWLFDNAAIRGFMRREGVASHLPSPKHLADWGAVPFVPVQFPYHPVISDIRWTRDSRSIYFLALNSAGDSHLCAADVETGLVKLLTPLDYDIERYTLLKGGLIYLATKSRSKSDKSGGSNGRLSLASTAITGKHIEEILFPDGGGAPTPRVRELWIMQNGHARRILDRKSELPRPDFPQYMDTLSVSPDSNYVVQVKPVTHVKEAWTSYIPMTGHEPWRSFLNISSSNNFQPRQYVLVSLLSGKITPLVDAPYGWILGYSEFPEAVWAHNQKRLLLTNTYLPLEEVPVERNSQPLHPCTVAALEMPSHRVTCIVFSRDATGASTDNPKPLRLDNVTFGDTDDEVVMHFNWWEDHRSQTEWYRFSGEKWRLIKVSVGAANEMAKVATTGETCSPISLQVKQTLNDPPALWAVDSTTGIGREIWNPNPQFTNMRLGEVSIYHWKDKSGYEWTGGLLRPVGYVPGNRYPLVIQTHGFEDSQFMTDGEYPTAMAARPLASAGIAVLQVPINRNQYLASKEAHLQVLGYEAAIDQLTSEGLVDPKRVGIIGFSRTCLYVETALIEDPNLFAAASIADGVDNSYIQSMIFDFDRESQAQRIYNAAPFGAGLKKWLQVAPSFQLDRVRTPLMITAIAPFSVLQEWEIYSSLYQQKKPVDFIYIPNGQHILQKPLERLASQQGNVDWFRFWLQGYERPDSGDRDEYLRWRMLRKEASEISPQLPN